MKKTKKRGKSSINKKLDTIIRGQSKLLIEEKKIEAEEKSEGKEERKLEALEEKQISELEKLERIEKEVESEVRQHPMTKVTIRDVYKGSLGAFVGIILHYTVFYGVEIAANLTLARATIIYILSFLMGMVFLYITGFKKVENSKTAFYLPLRTAVLYFVSLIVSIGVLFLFFPDFGHSFEAAYKQIATVSLIAVIGACTADIIGKE